jgi:hypothetical protein
MIEIAQDFERLLDNSVAFDAFDVRHEADAACVMFVARIIKALNLRKTHHNFCPAHGRQKPAWLTQTRESGRPEDDENCARAPHDCRIVILQPRGANCPKGRAGNTDAGRRNPGLGGSNPAFRKVSEEESAAGWRKLRRVSRGLTWARKSQPRADMGAEESAAG